MVRIPGLRRRILLTAVSVTALAVLWPIGRDLTTRFVANRHRSRKVNQHREFAATIAKRATDIKPWSGWDGEYRQLLLDLSAWHVRRAEAFRLANDAQLEDEDITDQIGVAELRRRLRDKLTDQPTSY